MKAFVLLLALVAVTPSFVSSQTMLRIPDLSIGVIQDTARLDSEWAFGHPGFDVDAIGSMTPSDSEEFWSATGLQGFQGTRLSLLGLEKGSSYSEVAAYASGTMWFTLGVAVTAPEGEADLEEDAAHANEAVGEEPSDLNAVRRLHEGGGTISIQALRPVYRVRIGGYSRLLATLGARASFDVDAFTGGPSTANAYAGDLLLSVLFQRLGNAQEDGLLLEVQMRYAPNWAVSPSYLTSLGEGTKEDLFYVIPTAVWAFSEDFRVHVSSVLGEAVQGDPVFTVGLTFLTPEE